MRVLVACEFSGVVRNAFLRRGHDAWSCDLLPTSQPPKDRHMRRDVRSVLRDSWDLVIAHPPCTYLSKVGVRWMYSADACDGKVGVRRYNLMVQACLFFIQCLEANAPRVCVENPIMHSLAAGLIGKRYTQIVQPWQYGHKESKATGLWLRGLPALKPTTPRQERIINYKGWMNGASRAGKMSGWVRSITFSGIAKAMAEQWGGPA